MARQGGGIENPECPCGMERFLSGGKGSKHSMNRQSHPVFYKTVARSPFSGREGVFLPLQEVERPREEDEFSLCLSLPVLGPGKEMSSVSGKPGFFRQGGPKAVREGGLASGRERLFFSRLSPLA